MSTTMRSSRARRYRGKSASPASNVGAFQRQLGKLTGRPAKTVEDQLRLVRPLFDRFVDAGRAVGNLNVVREYLASVLAGLQLSGTPLSCSNDFACAINRDVLKASGSLTDYLVDKSAAHKSALRKQMIRLQVEAAEVVAALDAPC